MVSLIQFYKKQIATYCDVHEQLKKKIYLLGTLRLLVFGGAMVVLWFFRDAGWPALTCIALSGGILFMALVVVHAKLFNRKNYVEAMIRLNENELRGIDYDFEAFDGAPEETDTQHAFSMDLDVFGTQSLFQSLNRTTTHVGKSLLIKWFKQPLTAKHDILMRQAAVKEMASKTIFRQHFHVTGALENTHKDDVSNLKLLSGCSTRFAQSRFWISVIWIVPALWLAVTAGVFWCGIPFSALGIMCAVAFLVSNMQGKRIHQIYKSVDKMEKLFQTYAALIGQIEKETFSAEALTDLQQTFFHNKRNVSYIIKKLSRIIGALDQRFSFAGIIVNMIYLRDMRQTMQLEAWLAAYAGSFDAWFDALGRMDALCSLGGFAFNHPDYVYPGIADTYFQMKGKALGHPLLHRDKCVKNNIEIAHSPYFLIVTGANMAGKSTYLRTVGVNFLIACTGLPVCAESLTVYPANLITSLRTADSLTAHESYFFAELKRLKMIIDRLHTGEKLFIVLDEILKGTNSEDKQKGSLALMKQLIALQSCGIIATHDLLLGGLEKTFPEQTRNHCFEADIAGDRLTFTYQLRSGIAQNMNACYLMKKMGITLE